jgi:anti-sigma B factor antagonist
MQLMLSSLTCMEKQRLAALMISWTGQLQQLIEVGTSKLLINLTDVTQLDSSSIGSIVRAFVSLKRRGANLKLLRPHGNVRLVLQTAHLLDVIPSIEDETQAIASFH